jgi:hypothetical protein
VALSGQEVGEQLCYCVGRCIDYYVHSAATNKLGMVIICSSYSTAVVRHAVNMPILNRRIPPCHNCPGANCLMTRPIILQCVSSRSVH